MTIPIIPNPEVPYTSKWALKKKVGSWLSIYLKYLNILLKLDHVPETTIYSVYSMTSFPNLWSILFKAPGGS